MVSDKKIGGRKMSELISIKHELERINNIMVVDWSVSNVCNYRCSYCPPNTHSGSYKFVPIEDILDFSNRVVKHYKDQLGKEIYFLYTGGEVTLYDGFLTLIKAQKEGGNKIGISSNGSKDLAFWKEAKKYLQHVSLSYHSEFTDVDHFIDVINEIKDSTFTHVNIMVEPDHFEKCIDAAYRIYEETDEITLDLQVVLRDFQEPYIYTEEQKKIMQEVGDEFNSKQKLKRERIGYRALMKLVYDDGTEKLIKGGDIITQNLNTWKGWECNVGLELLVIDMKGDIKRSWCGDAPIIGNIKDEEIHFPTTPYICTKERCTGGVTDTMVTKNKISKGMESKEDE